MKWIIPVGLATLICSAASAQSKRLTGRVISADQSRPVRSASIRNVLTGATVLSYSEGQFSISVSRGHILAFSASGYYTDTLTVGDSLLIAEKPIFKMRSLPATLPDVVVQGRWNAYQADSILRRKAFLSEVGEIHIPTIGKANDLGFGIALNIDRFSSREKKKRSAHSLFDITEQEAYINHRWSDSLVRKYTGLRGDSLSDFMQSQRPTWQWLRKNLREEDLLYYINQSLKKYFRRPGQ